MHKVVTVAEKMRGALAAAALTMTMLVLPTGSPFLVEAHAESSIKIVVNDEAITSLDIQARAKLLQLAMHLGAGAATKQAQEELIDERLRMQDGARRGIVPSEDAVQAALASIASRSKMTPQQFEQALARGGVSMSTFKARIRAQMVWGRVVRSKIQADMKNEAADLIKQMSNREKNASDVTANDYVLQRVVFAVRQKASPAEVSQRKAEAEALRSRFKSCSTDLEVAKKLKEVAVVNVGRKLANEVPLGLKDDLQNTAEGRLTAPQRSELGFEMYAVCSKIAVTGEAAVSAGLDAEALDKRGEEVSKALTKELRQKANIAYR